MCAAACAAACCTARGDTVASTMSLPSATLLASEWVSQPLLDVLACVRHLCCRCGMGIGSEGVCCEESVTLLGVMGWQSGEALRGAVWWDSSQPPKSPLVKLAGWLIAG